MSTYKIGHDEMTELVCLKLGAIKGPPLGETNPRMLCRCMGQLIKQMKHLTGQRKRVEPHPQGRLGLTGHPYLICDSNLPTVSKCLKPSVDFVLLSGHSVLNLVLR